MSSKLFILGFFAILATVSLAQSEKCTPNTEFANEEECVFSAAHPDGGNCYYSSLVNPFSACDVIEAPFDCNCIDYCLNCLACLRDYGCCEKGLHTNNYNLCYQSCVISSAPVCH